MTISSTVSRADYIGGAGVLIFPYPFRVFAATDLLVYADDLLLSNSVDYVVSGVGDAGGGNVTFTTAPDGLAVAIIRNIPTTQEIDFVENDSLPANTLEDGLDKLTMLDQQQNETLSRALKFSSTSTFKDVDVEDLVASKVLLVNSTADGIEMGDIGDASAIALPVTPANGGTGQTSLSAARDALLASSDSRTATIAIGATVRVTTSGSPAGGIGTGIKVQAQSADETPCDIGQLDFLLSNTGSGAEQSYFTVKVRRAGAALAAIYNWVAGGTHMATITHSHTADRTHVLPDIANLTLIGQDNYFAPRGVKRYSAQGTSHDGTEYVLHANWGSTAAMSPTPVGNDMGATVVINCAGSGISTNPTVVLTFKDGGWENAPEIVCCRGDGGAPTTAFWYVQSTTLTTATFVFLGLPVSGTAYTLRFISMGR